MQLYYYGQTIIQMITKENLNNLSKSKQSLKKNQSPSIMTIKSSLNKSLTSPSNSNLKLIKDSEKSKGKEESLSKPKSSFRLFIGKKKQEKSSNKGLNSSNSSVKQNMHPNINPSMIQIQKPIKGKTLKDVRLAISKPGPSLIQKRQINMKKGLENKGAQLIKESQRYKQSNSQPSMEQYLPKSIVQDFKKISLIDFTILVQTKEEESSSEYLAINKKLNFIFTIKKFNKNIIIEQQLTEQLVESIKIHLYLSNEGVGENIQKLYAIFHDINSVYLVLQPVLPEKNCIKGSTYSQQKINSYNKILTTLDILHRKKIMLRNISLGTICNQMGVLKITNITRAASFGTKRRQSFYGCLTQAPHQVTIGESYDSSYDMWSLGLIFYQTILELPPFQKESALNHIQNLQFNLSISLSNELSYLITSLLCQRQKRLTAQECLKLNCFSESKSSNLVSRDIFNFWIKQ